MRAIWKGHISFALVTIPVAVVSASKSNELGFKYLHKPDMSPVSYKRFCEADQQEVPWEEITRGYEFEKGRFVEVTDEEFKQANAELSRTIKVVEFVDAAEIDAVYFDKPYYLEVQPGGERPYALMHDALAGAGKVAIARVVLKSREHLAAVRPSGRILAMQMLRFAHELVDSAQVGAPVVDDLSEKERALASTLIDTMVASFDPGRYKDEYREQLLSVIRAKVENVEPSFPGSVAPVPGKVVDLMEVLKKSLAEKKDKQEKRPVREKTVAADARGRRQKETKQPKRASKAR
jgi:DNA end-binding protein Ku